MLRQEEQLLTVTLPTLATKSMVKAERYMNCMVYFADLLGGPGALLCLLLVFDGGWLGTCADKGWGGNVMGKRGPDHR